MDIKKLAESLNPTERKVVKVLDNFSSFHDIMKVTGLKDIEVMRAFQWLQNKNVVRIKEERKELVFLDENGKKYLREGLPEKRFLQAIEASAGISEITKKTGLADEEVMISLGVLKSKKAIEIKKEKGLVISIMEHGKHLLKHGFPEEQFLKEQFPKELNSLNEGEKLVLENLKKRKKIVKVEFSKIINAELQKQVKN